MTAVLFSVMCLVCGLEVAAQRVAVVIRGEPFRYNSHEYSREAGIAGYGDQMRASRSHLEHLILPMMYELNVSVDVFLVLPQSPLNNELLLWYGPFVKGHSFVTTRTTRDETFVEQVLSGGEYSGIMLLRPDIILKPIFSCSFVAASWDKILFTFRIKWGDGPIWQTVPCHSGLDRVSDSMVWIPDSAFERVLTTGLHRKIWLNHDAMCSVVPAFERSEVSYIWPYGSFDSDPEKVPNPLYKLAGRSESYMTSSLDGQWRTNREERTYAYQLEWNCSDIGKHAFAKSHLWGTADE